MRARGPIHARRASAPFRPLLYGPALSAPLIAVGLPMFMIAILMAANLKRLRQTANGSHPLPRVRQAIGREL